MTDFAINFRRPVAEVLIIVTGVLIALGLDNWNDNRIERNLETQYLARLLEEVSINVRVGEQIIELANQQIDPLSSVDAILRQSRESRSMTDMVIASRSGALSLGWALSEFTDVVFEELRGTGNLGIVRDIELRSFAACFTGEIACLLIE